MASITSVSVLAPNGRRQVVKVTPNTTILQVLEEVCKKQGFKSEEYELRHQNRALDLSSVIRFSGLPNLASLEMAAAAKTRTESSVGLVLQLESGSRVSGDFLPTASLWQVVETLAPAEAGAVDAALALVYLRREVSGRADLQRTTLRDLGLTGGRALLRLVAATTDGPRQQANVSTLLTRPVPATVSPATVSPATVAPATVTSATVSPATVTPETRAAACQPMEVADPAHAVQPTQQREKQQAQAALERERQLQLKREMQREREIQALEQQIVLLEERDAVVFRAESSHADLDLPDDFFEPTVEDARVLYRDLKAAATSLQEAPLMTAALRGRGAESGAELPAVLRVRFPDGTVLQAVFRPAETVADVELFVRKHLAEPGQAFTLFTTPPRVELPSSAQLREVGCVRGCLLHFASGTGAGAGFLRPALMERTTTPAAASLLAARARRIPPSLPQPAVATTTSHASLPAPTARPRPAAPAGHAPSGHAPAAAGHVPKWFKPV